MCVFAYLLYVRTFMYVCMYVCMYVHVCMYECASFECVCMCIYAYLTQCECVCFEIWDVFLLRNIINNLFIHRLCELKREEHDDDHNMELLNVPIKDRKSEIFPNDASPMNFLISICKDKIIYTSWYRRTYTKIKEYVLMSKSSDSSHLKTELPCPSKRKQKYMCVTI